MFVTFWKPVVVAAATTMNTPRRSSAIKSEKPPEAHVEAISVMVATISQMAPVRISKSRKKESVSPRWVFTYSEKLMAPKSISTIQTISSANEW